MPWSDLWPPAAGEPVLAAHLSDVAAALAGRDALVPAGGVPAVSARFEPLRGTPAGGTPPARTFASLQAAVAAQLALEYPLRWWDLGREQLYTLPALCQDAFGAAGWTCDLTATEGGAYVNRWRPAVAAVPGELYHAVNRLTRLRVLPSASVSVVADSVYRLGFGITDWPTDRADTFALFDGADDGVRTGLAYHCGLGAALYDDGFTQQWLLEPRALRMTFPTEALAGATVASARLAFTAEAPGGAADFEAAFPVEVTDAGGIPFAAFDSDAHGARALAVPLEAVRTDAETVFHVRSARPDTDDRPAWVPGGPNYSSTYREGLAVAGPVRLIVEVAFEYHG